MEKANKIENYFSLIEITFDLSEQIQSLKMINSYKTKF